MKPLSLSQIWHRIFQLMDGLSGASIGFAFYGSWGAWVNWPHGTWIGLRSGLAQGCMSFIVTLSGVVLMRTLFQVSGPIWLRTSTAALGSLLLIYAAIIGLHLYLGTPEIFLTLLPGLPITIGFCLVFSVSLARFRQNTPETSPQGGLSH